MKKLLLFLLSILTFCIFSLLVSDAEELDNLEKMAEQGDVKSQVKLAEAYKKGRGFEQDYYKAFLWYKKAAEQGYAQGQRPLGVLYEMGQGVPKDLRKAAEWYRKAAEQGVVRAQVNLGLLYETGQGVEKSYEKALAWYKKAADKRYGRGLNHQGLLYEKGLGVKKNVDTALSLYEKGAEVNYSKAMLNLGRVYELGADNIQQNLEKAASWFNRAIKNGYTAASKDLKRVQLQTSKSVIVQEYSPHLEEEKIEAKVDKVPVPKASPTPLTKKPASVISMELEEVKSQASIANIKVEPDEITKPLLSDIDPEKEEQLTGQPAIKQIPQADLKPLPKGENIKETAVVVKSKIDKIEKQNAPENLDKPKGTNVTYTLMIIAGNIILVSLFWALMLKRRRVRVKTAESSLLISDLEIEIKGIRNQVEELHEKISND